MKEDIKALNEKMIINCTSIGSRGLFNDQDFLPVRVHIVHFKSQEGIDYMLSENLKGRPQW